MQAPDFDDGDLAEQYAAVDWAATSLGPVEGWSDSLRWSLELIRSTRFPVTLLWGPELVLLYNEAYTTLIADKHPAALGRPAQEVFPEAWDVIGPMLHDVLGGGESTWSEDVLLPLERSGYLEEAWFTYSYSPVRGRGGVVEGVIDIAAEGTGRILAVRRLTRLAQLNQRLATVQRSDDLAQVALDFLDEAHDDIVASDLVDFSGSRRTDPATLDPRLARFVDRPGEVLADRLVTRPSPDGLVVQVPVDADDRSNGLTLVLLLHPMLPEDDDRLEFVRLLGWTVGQHLARVVARETERELSRALQDALLSRPRHSSAYEIAVHYQPAEVLAQVGGDWYDVFPRADGATMVVVGDVIGHDHGAAATMGQLRNLTRGIAHLERSSPAAVVSTLERAMQGLGVDTLATGVIGDLRERDDGRATFTWTNAGHLPPVLIEGTSPPRLLEREANTMIGIGIDDGRPREDHEVALSAGSTLVLYTDGLVERRHEPLDIGLKRLLDHLSDCGSMSAQQICDHALSVLSDLDRTEDDVALMVVRVLPRPPA